MAYKVVNGAFVWAGPGPEPMVGEAKPAYEERAGLAPIEAALVPVGYTPPPVATQNGYPVAPVVVPGAIVEVAGAVGLGFLEDWITGALLGEENGNGNGMEPSPPYNDWGGVGKRGREGYISAGRTTKGTGPIKAGTFRAWDPVQQRYYQLEGGQAYSDITLAPGKTVPGGDMVVKSWVNHAWRKDNSLASTQMARLANGRMMSLSEDGIVKSWRPVKNIVMARGKTTLSQAVTAQRYLDKMWRKVAKKTKQLKLA